MDCVPNWPGLLPELLGKIVGRLESMKDVMEFRRVCTSWRAAATEDTFPAVVSKIPLLMLAEKDGSSYFRQLYNFSVKKIRTTIPFPEAKGNRCMDVGFGWVLILPSFGGEVSLVKPFTGARIDLPDYKSLPRDDSEAHIPEYHYIRRAILSTDPTDHQTSDFDLVVLAHGLKLGLGLAFWRQRDKIWRRIEESDAEWVPNEPHMINLGLYSNIGRYKEKVYAIDYFGGNLWQWDPFKTRFVRTAIVLRSFLNTMPYLVESSKGELFIIIRSVPPGFRDYWEHTTFIVLKVDEANGKYEQVQSMGNDAVFLGDNVAVSVSADEFPGVIKPSCIYFTDDCADRLERFWESDDPNKINKGGGKSMGVFKCSDRSIKRFEVESFSFTCPPSASILPWRVCNHIGRSQLESLSYKCPPLWIFPWR